MRRFPVPQIPMSAALSTQFQTQLEIEKKENISLAGSFAKRFLETDMPAEQAEFLDKAWMERRTASRAFEKVPSVLMWVTLEEAKGLMKNEK